MRLFLLAATFAAPLYAQTLDPRYEAIGTFEGALQENPLTLLSLYDREKDRSMVRLRDKSGFATINISARTIQADGTPKSPSVSFTIGPIGAGGSDVRSDIFFSNEAGYFVADQDNSNRATLTEFIQDGTSISFGVSADLIPVKRGDDGFIVDESRSNLQLSGTFSGAVTDVD